MSKKKNIERAEAAFFGYVRRPTRRSLAKVVERFHVPLWNLALRLTGNETDASDLCQDLFLRLLLNPPDPDSIRSARGYLLSRISTLSRAQRRSAERRLERERRAMQEFPPGEDLGVEDSESLRLAVDELPDHIRVVIVLRYFAGLSNKEIATDTGRSERSVERDLHQARGRLRRRLGDPLLGFLPVIGLTESPPPGRLLVTVLFHRRR